MNSKKALLLYQIVAGMAPPPIKGLTNKGYIRVCHYSKTKFKMCFSNIPFTVIKNCCWLNVLKETKSHFFVCLAMAESISISVSQPKARVLL